MKINTVFPITLATYVTLLRFACIPCILASMLHHAWIVASIFFVIASITDVLDGMIARSLNEVSWLGTLLDPLVDKLLLITVYAGLVYGQLSPVPLPVWFLVFVIGNELILILGALYWSLLKERVEIRPSRLAKLVGVGQFLFISWALLTGFVGGGSSLIFYQILLLLTVARTCVLTQYGIQTYNALVITGD